MSRRTPPPDLFFDWDKAGDNHHGVEPIFTRDEIIARVDELAGQLDHWFESEPIVEVIMNGAMMFAADLVRAMSARGAVMEMDFIRLKKHRREGRVELLSASNLPVDGRDVLLVEDIFETGRTLAFARDHYLALGARSVTSVTLLDKSNNRKTLLQPDFIGFQCPDIFVIGYGMDIGFRYRELPFIGRLGQA